MSAMNNGGNHSVLRVGFACHWDRNERATWSQTPWQLRGALREYAQITDLRPSLSQPEQQLFRLVSARRAAGGGLASPWKQHRTVQRRIERRLADAERTAGALDAIVEISDLGTTTAPYFVVVDLIYAQVLSMLDGDGAAYRQFPLDGDRYKQLRDRQERVFASAAGVFTLSEWTARSVVADAGLPAERVHVLYPGSNVPDIGPSRPRDTSDRPRNRLLFVGHDFYRKGGDDVVAAVAALRAGGRDVTLTVVGPPDLPEAVSAAPDGITYLGPRTPEEISELLWLSDLFVLPSRFEAFGIVFVEALTRGVPCIATDQMAMPELIRNGSTGMLVPPRKPDTLAAAIDKALDDDELYRATADAAPDIAAKYNWANSARIVISTINQAIGH
jgi:glycosyltransferase involved in cell wall biosynthesis